MNISRVYIENNASSYNFYDTMSNNIKKVGMVGSHNFLLEGQKLVNLTDWIGFTEIRIRCTGSPGRLFHAKINSTKNANSLALFNYYVHSGPLPNDLCDAFEYLPNDNSTLKWLSTTVCQTLVQGETGRKTRRLYTNQCSKNFCVSAKVLQ